MAIDLPVSRDLSLIFERDEVHEAFSGHCSKTHLDVEAVRTCEFCRYLRVVLANAITEWLALVDQDRASKDGWHKLNGPHVFSLPAQPLQVDAVDPEDRSGTE